MIQPALNSRVELDSRTDLRCPVLQLPGPLPAPPAFGAIPPTADQQDLLDHWTVILREWYHDPTVSVAEVREALRVATLYTFLPGYEIQWLASQWRVILLQDGATTLEDTFDAALKDYLDRFTVQWLLQDASQPAVQISDPDEVFEHWSMIDPLQCPIPRPIRYHQVVIAHLFSGRRRPGDFQSYAESARLPDGLSCLAISVDIIFSVTWGRETLELFLHAIHCGIILCMLAGPPCESWSIARLRGGVHDDGPRPVRSIGELFGLSHLRLNELRQVCTGNELLGVSLQLAMAMWLAGALFVLEHPMEPEVELAPSIWRLPLVRFFAGLPNCTRILCFQGYYGAVSAKPTHFLLTHPPVDAKKIMDDCRTTLTLPVGGTIGRGTDGRFKTMQLKEYPPGLCCAIWQVVEKFIHDRGVEPVLAPCPDTILSRLSQLDAKLDKSATSVGPDFNPVSHIN